MSVPAASGCKLPYLQVPYPPRGQQDTSHYFRAHGVGFYGLYFRPWGLSSG